MKKLLASNSFLMWIDFQVTCLILWRRGMVRPTLRGWMGTERGWWAMVLSGEIDR